MRDGAHCQSEEQAGTLGDFVHGLAVRAPSGLPGRVSRTRLSAEVIRNALLHVQYSVLEQVGTKHRYVISSRVSREAVKVYQAMGLKHSQVPTKLED